MRFLVIADVHGNLPALDAILTAEANRDGILFLGDGPSAGPHPDEVVKRLVEIGALCIRGNHDTELVEIDVERPSRSPHDAWMQWGRTQLSDESLEAMRSWPFERRLVVDGRPIYMTHGLLPPEYGKRLWPDSSDEAYAFVAAQCQESTILVGHSHVQSVVKRVGRTFCNPGTVGQQRLGIPEACYAVLENGLIQLASVPYDVDSVAKDMAHVPIDQDWLAARISAFRQGRLPDSDGLGSLEHFEHQGYR